MPTKRNTTTAKQAETKTAGLTPEAAFDRGREVLAQRMPAPEHAAPSRPPYPNSTLSRTHTMVIDAVTEMLHSGGNPDDVDALLRAAMSHTRRRYLGRWTDDPAKNDANVAECIKDDFEDWKYEIMVGWRKNKRPERDQRADAQTITELIRFNAREQARDGFEEFMAGASMEETTFIGEVFSYRASRSLVPDSREDDMYIASAFEIVIGQDEVILRVPEPMTDKVQRYIDALREVDDKAV